VIGRMTAGAWSPFLECGIGYLRLDAAGHRDANPVSVRDRDGEPHAAEIVSLPFYDKHKKIPRGLDTSIPEPPE
jgi:aminomethyltransferase